MKLLIVISTNVLVCIDAIYQVFGVHVYEYCMSVYLPSVSDMCSRVFVLFMNDVLVCIVIVRQVVFIVIVH